MLPRECWRASQEFLTCEQIAVVERSALIRFSLFYLCLDTHARDGLHVMLNMMENILFMGSVHPVITSLNRDTRERCKGGSPPPLASQFPAGKSSRCDSFVLCRLPRRVGDEPVPAGRPPARIHAGRPGQPSTIIDFQLTGVIASTLDFQ